MTRTIGSQKRRNLLHDLPVQLPLKCDLGINVGTAKVLNLVVLRVRARASAGGFSVSVGKCNGRSFLGKLNTIMKALRCDLHAVRALLGHATIEATARYLSLEAESDPIGICRAFNI